MGHSKGSRKKEVYSIQAYFKKEEKSQIHNLTLHLKELEKEQQIKPKASRIREIIKIRVETNDIETDKQKPQYNISIKQRTISLEA